jgi:hypothetical protein
MEARLMDAKALLAKAEEQRCACGKRPRGDQQAIVEGPTVETFDVVGSRITRSSCWMKCLVCNDRHKFAMFMPAGERDSDG